MTKNNAAAAMAAETSELTGAGLDANAGAFRTDSKVEAALNEKLDPANVTVREKAGVKLSYVEGWYVIGKANEIFGPLNWSRETIYCREVCRYQNDKGNEVVGYEAKVRITINSVLIKEGTGHGNGIAKDLFSAIESAAKEAETDAMKRAFMMLGNPLGLALYDKKRAGVSDSVFPNAAKRNDWVDKFTSRLERAPDIGELKAVWDDEATMLKELKESANEYDEVAYDHLVKFKDQVKASIISIGDR
jgi:DNA repair and recombination protein RAD52